MPSKIKSTFSFFGRYNVSHMHSKPIVSWKSKSFLWHITVKPPYIVDYIIYYFHNFKCSTYYASFGGIHLCFTHTDILLFKFYIYLFNFGCTGSSLRCSGLVAPGTCGILVPWPGSRTTCPHVEGGFWTTGPTNLWKSPRWYLRVH